MLLCQLKIPTDFTNAALVEEIEAPVLDDNLDDAGLHRNIGCIHEHLRLQLGYL